MREEGEALNSKPSTYFVYLQHRTSFIMIHNNIFIYIYIYIYMVQYAIIQPFCEKSGKNWIFKKLIIFKEMHQISSYISRNVHRTVREQDFIKNWVQGVPKNSKKKSNFWGNYQKFENTQFLLLYFSSPKKATENVFLS